MIERFQTDPRRCGGERKVQIFTANQFWSFTCLVMLRSNTVRP